MRMPLGKERIVGLLAALALGSVVYAGDVSNVIFRVEATNSEGTGYVEITEDQLVPSTGGKLKWTGGGLSVYPGNDDSLMPLATLGQALVQYKPTPAAGVPYYLNMVFDVTAGATDTHFVVSSGWQSFTHVLPASMLVGPTGGAFASVGVTLTDNAQYSDGATAVGDSNNGQGIFRALYNQSPSPTMLTDLINLVQVNSGGTADANAAIGAPGAYQTIPVATADMALAFDFTLSARDQFSGNSSFYVMPEPGALGVMLCMGVALLRRR